MIEVSARSPTSHARRRTLVVVQIDGGLGVCFAICFCCCECEGPPSLGFISIQRTTVRTGGSIRWPARSRGMRLTVLGLSSIPNYVNSFLEFGGLKGGVL